MGGPCRVKEADFLGAWVRLGRIGAFEEMEFVRDGPTRAFKSWMHSRPDAVGWNGSFSACTLRLGRVGDPALDYTFVVAMRGKNQLLLREGKDAAARFRRVKS
jgi:hypothetical protein